MPASACRVCVRFGATAGRTRKPPGRSDSIRRTSASTAIVQAVIRRAFRSISCRCAPSTPSRARPNAEAFAQVFGGDHAAVYVYTRETVHAGHHFHARMFAPHLGVREDPATGSAAAAFAGAFMQYEPLGDGEHSFVIEQGYEMGRPSEIDLQIVIREGALASAEIGGGAVVVSEGPVRL